MTNSCAFLRFLYILLFYLFFYHFLQRCADLIKHLIKQKKQIHLRLCCARCGFNGFVVYGSATFLFNSIFILLLNFNAFSISELMFFIIIFLPIYILILTVPFFLLNLISILKHCLITGPDFQVLTLIASNGTLINLNEKLNLCSIVHET